MSFPYSARTHELKFGQESYDRPKLTRPIRNDVLKFGHTPVCHSARDFSVLEHSVRSRTVPKPHEIGL